MKSLFSKSIGLTSNSYAYIHFPLLLPKPINHRLLWENKDGQLLQDQHLRWGVTGRETAVKEGWEGIKGNDLWLSCNVFFFFFKWKKKVKGMEEACSQVRRSCSSLSTFCNVQLYKHSNGDSVPKPWQNKYVRKSHLSLCLNQFSNYLTLWTHTLTQAYKHAEKLWNTEK